MMQMKLSHGGSCSLAPAPVTFIIACVIGIISFQAPISHARVIVVTTTPDFAAIAREIGGPAVEVTSLGRGTEDPHFIDPRPSFILLLNRADVLIEGGAGLETGWLPSLIESARNRKILPGSSGRIVAAEAATLLEVPPGPVDRSMGDIHPFGNPHFMLDPLNGKRIASQITDRFCLIDPGVCQTYRAHLKRFEDRLNMKVLEWQGQMEPLRGTKVLTYHKSFEYFAERFGLNVVNTIEPKPGIPPTPSHMEAVIKQMKGEGVRLILLEPNWERKTPAFIAEQTGAQIVLLPTLVGGVKEVTDYFGLFDYIVNRLIEAAQKR